MSTQSRALELASILEKPGYGWHSTPVEVAAELRRQDQEIADLSKAYGLLFAELGKALAELERIRALEPVGWVTAETIPLLAETVTHDWRAIWTRPVGAVAVPLYDLTPKDPT